MDRRKLFAAEVFLALFLAMMLAASTLSAQEVSLNPSNVQRDLGGKVMMNIEMSGATSLLSMGVKVTFPPDILQVESAEKNEAVWKFAPLEPEPSAYLPEVEVDNTNGVVKMIGGTLTGVSGDVILGTIVFQCSAANTGSGTIAVELVHDRATMSYDHFVGEKPGPDQDPPVFDDSIIFTGAEVSVLASGALEGDFNGNGRIDSLDVRRFKAAMNDYDPACDFNANGRIDSLDVRTFKGDM